MRQLIPLLFLICLSITGCCTSNTLHATSLSSVQSASHDTHTAIALVTDFGPHDIHQTFCSAVWINSDRILTAAHCVEGWAHMKRQQSIITALTDAGYPEYIAMLISSMDLEELQASDTPQLLKDAVDIIANVPPVSIIGLPITYVVPDDVVDVGFRPKQVHSSTAIVYNKQLDLAILAANGPIPHHTNARLAETTPAVGSVIHSVGTPDHLFFTYRQGYVSAYRHTLSRGGMPSIRGPFMQIINGMSPGDSGSAVFDQDNHLVGISSFVDEDSGTGFCIHLDTIRSLLLGQHLITGHLDTTLPDPDLSDSSVNLQ